MTANSTLRYGTVAMAFHWAIAAAILFMLWLGPFIASLPETDARQFPLFQLHKSIGLSILILSLLRLGWRVLHPVPALPSHMARWERAAARGVHAVFYLLMIAVPLLGWASVSAAPLGVPTMWFGLFEWPHIPMLDYLPRAEKRILDPLLIRTHGLFAFAMLGLVVLHVLAALKHHFRDRDNVLKHMLPWTTLEP